MGESCAISAMRRVTSWDATHGDKFLLAGNTAFFQNSGNFLSEECKARRAMGRQTGRPAGDQNCQRSQAKNTLPLL